MSQFKLAGAAFKNMLRSAASDPIWAIVALCMAPFRAFKPVVGSIVLLGLVGMIVAVVGDLILAPFGLSKQVARSIIGLVVIAVLLPLAFRLITNPMIHHFGSMEGDTHGSARFATDKEVAPLARADTGLLIGRDAKTGKPLRYSGPAHLLTMAPTRTGKGVGTIIPNLLTADRSVICIDPKGENVKIAGRARRQFGPVHVLDPFGVTGLPSAAFTLSIHLTQMTLMSPKTQARWPTLSSSMNRARQARHTGMRKPKP